MTSARGPAETFAAFTSTLVAGYDVTDLMASLVSECGRVVGSGAVAVMGCEPHGELCLLSATSHRAAELEMLQVQRLQGPCIDAVSTGEAVLSVGEQESWARWEGVGPAMTAAGFASVAAFPMRWRGSVLGALNVFWVEPEPLSGDAICLCLAFANVASLVLVQSSDLSWTKSRRGCTRPWPRAARWSRPRAPWPTPRG